MPYQLCASVSFCWVDGRAVFLDTRRDRYFRLAPSTEAIFRALQDADGQAAPDVEHLAGLGLVEATADITRPIRAAQAQRPTTSLVDGGPCTAGLKPLTLVEVGWRLGRARVGLKGTPLATTLSRVRDSRPSGTAAAGTPRHRVADLARRFNTARRRTPFAQACLPDALALLDFLAGRNAYADLVFGVRLDPFSAHCWVQAGDAVLNDAFDPVVAHTPILVV